MLRLLLLGRLELYLIDVNEDAYRPSHHDEA